MTAQAPTHEQQANGLAGVPRVLVVLAAAAMLTITLAGVRSVGSLVGPVFLALVLVITFHPVRARLERRLPGWLASVVMVVLLYLVLAVLITMLLVSLGRLVRLVPSYAGEFNGLLEDALAALADLGVSRESLEAALSALDVGQVAGVATNVFSGLLGVLSDLVFIGALLLFMAVDAAPTTRVLGAVAAHHAGLVEGLRSFAVGTRSYMAVSAGFGLVVAVLDWMALLVIGIPGAFVWGVLAFVTNFVPNIGFVIGLVPPALLGLLEGGPGLMLAVIVVYVVLNVVIQTVIQPRVVGDRVGLSGTITFVSLAFWAFLIGPLGALLAVPLTLLVRGLLVDADPSAHWVLPLISGKQEPERQPVNPPEPVSPPEPPATPASRGSSPGGPSDPR